VRLLGLRPDIPGLGRGVAEGTMQFDGESADAVFDLYQPGHPRKPRKMGLRWVFDGPDAYHETLLEATGSAGLAPLGEWEYVRTTPSAGERPRPTEAQPVPAAHLKAFEALLGHTFEGTAAGPAGDGLRVRMSFEWIPYVEAIRARVIAPAENGDPAQILDAYVYQHPTKDELECLALSRGGGVQEGVVSVLDGGAVELALKSYEGEEVVPHLVRLDREENGNLRQRAWSGDGDDRTLVLDLALGAVEPEPAGKRR